MVTDAPPALTTKRSFPTGHCAFIGRGGFDDEVGHAALLCLATDERIGARGTTRGQAAWLRLGAERRCWRLSDDVKRLVKWSSLRVRGRRRDGGHRGVRSVQVSGGGFDVGRWGGRAGAPRRDGERCGSVDRHNDVRERHLALESRARSFQGLGEATSWRRSRTRRASVLGVVLGHSPRRRQDRWSSASSAQGRSAGSRGWAFGGRDPDERSVRAECDGILGTDFGS
jgi:hypothetical protein